MTNWLLWCKPVINCHLLLLFAIKLYHPATFFLIKVSLEKKLEFELGNTREAKCACREEIEIFLSFTWLFLLAWPPQMLGSEVCGTMLGSFTFLNLP